MERPNNDKTIENEEDDEISQNSFLNQCNSCCYEFQQTVPFPYKCVYNDILNQLRSRLKRAEAELACRDKLVSALNEQNASMKNYCRCSLEETKAMKLKYFQLVEDMENMKKYYMKRIDETTVEKEQPLETYLRCEVDKWKKENEEMHGKIETIESEIQKLLHRVDDALNAQSMQDSQFRMDKLEKMIEEQSEILERLHARMAENEQMIESKLNEIIRKTSEQNVKDLHFRCDEEQVTKQTASTNKQVNGGGSYNLVDQTIKTESPRRIEEEITEKKIEFLESFAPPKSMLSKLTPNEKEITPHDSPLVTSTEKFAANKTEPNDSNLLNDQIVEDLKDGRHDDEKAKTKYKDVSSCCIILNNISEGKEGRLVIFQNVDKRMIPICCKSSTYSRDFLNSNDNTEIQESFFQKKIAPLINSRSSQDEDLPSNKEDANDEPKAKNKEEICIEDGILLEDIEIIEFSPSDSSKLKEGTVRVKTIQKSEKSTEREALKTNVEGNIPGCCKTLPIVKENVVIQEITDEPEDFDTASRITDEDDDIPIIHEFLVSKQNIPETFETYNNKTMEKMSQTDGSMPLREYIVPETSTIVFKDNLENIANELRTILSVAEQELVFLQDLKEDVAKISNGEWIKDIPFMKRNVELLNKTTKTIDADLKNIKTDMERVLEILDRQQGEQQTQKNSDLVELLDKNNVDRSKVWERISTLEKHLCKCGLNIPRDRKVNVCQPSTGCSCRSNKVDNKKANDQQSDDSKKSISVTVRQCFLPNNDGMKAPRILTFDENGYLNGIPALTYESNQVQNPVSK